MARKLAGKVSLATRIDALADDNKAGNNIGVECLATLENALRTEMERGPKKISGVAKQQDKYNFKR